MAYLGAVKASAVEACPGTGRLLFWRRTPKLSKCWLMKKTLGQVAREVGIESYLGTLGVLSKKADPGLGSSLAKEVNPGTITGAGRVLLGENNSGGGTGASTGKVKLELELPYRQKGVSISKANTAPSSAWEGA